MTGATVVQTPTDRIEFCQEQAGQRDRRADAAKVAIDTGDNRVWVGDCRTMTAHQTHQVRGPHSRSQPFTADVAEREDYAVFGLPDRKEISRQMTHREDLAGDLNVAVTQQTGRAQPAVYLRGFKDRAVQL